MSWDFYKHIDPFSFSICGKGEMLFNNNENQFWEIKLIGNEYPYLAEIGIVQYCDLKNVNLNSCCLNEKGQICQREDDGLLFSTLNKPVVSIKEYTTPLPVNATIGIYLNTKNGTLEFYVNSEYLGVAVENLKHDRSFATITCNALETFNFDLLRTITVPHSTEEYKFY